MRPRTEGRFYASPFRLASFAVVFVYAAAASAVPAKSRRVMISGPSPYAVEVGKEIASKGGNAVDVAVAAALSLAVTHPYYGALGGGGFAVIKTVAGSVEALDFREVAPQAANPSFFQRTPLEASITGPLAVGVPGIPAGLWELHKKRGKLHWSRLFPPSINLAAKGFEVSGDWADITREESKRFNPAALRFFARGGKHLKPGEILKQPELARALREMSARGIEPFYRGLIARDVVDSIKAAGGVVTMDDMKSYKPRWLQPLRADYQGYELWSMPPPSSGGAVSQTALKLLDLWKWQDTKVYSVEEYHRIAEALKLAFRGRGAMGDPAFAKNPIEAMLNPARLAVEAKRFKPDKAIEVEPLKSLPIESTETTHLAVMTAEGEGVAMTLTLNGSYGSGLATEKYGIALNNEMDDFATRPGEPNMYGLIQGTANQVEAGKRPLSSMSPTLALKDGKLAFAVGAQGGPRIISAVTQTIYRALARGQDLDLAIQAPRLHHQFSPNVVYVDGGRFAPETIDGLKAKGHAVESSWMSKAYAIRLNSDGILEGAFDSRREGAAGGY